MSALNLRERRALRYASIKHDGDRELRAAQAHQHVESSTPTLQRISESNFGFAVWLIGSVIIAGRLMGLI